MKKIDKVFRTTSLIKNISWRLALILKPTTEWEQVSLTFYMKKKGENTLIDEVKVYRQARFLKTKKWWEFWK